MLKFASLLIFPFLFGTSVSAVRAETTITINGQTVQSSPAGITVTVGGTGTGNIVQGSGKRASESRNLGSFSELRLDIAADVVVTHGELVRCTVTADDNILPLILTDRHNESLHISATESYSTREGVRIEIEAPLLSKVEINGSGVVRIASVTKKELHLALNGSGSLHAEGDVEELVVKMNGSGNLNAAGLRAERAVLTLNGSGNADIHVAGDLSVRLNGSGNVSFAGSPSSRSLSVSGSGQVRQR